MPPATRTRSSRPKAPTLDAACAAAVDLARAGVEEVAAPGEVGEHLEVQAEDERVVTHFFACRKPGYRGWRWAATVARAPRARVVTLDEAVLLPGPEALLAPEWLPWSERLRPGDVGVGDLLPAAADDERLEPGYAATGVLGQDADDPGGLGLLDGDEDATGSRLAYELGLGRPRVLSLLGREEAADRWYAGDRGPGAPVAQAAPAQCATCGFLLLLAGSLRRAFGVCANEYSPDDGQVVSVDHGCGAHSEAAAASVLDAAVPVMDEVGYDVLSMHGDGEVDDVADVVDVADVADVPAAALEEHAPGSVDPTAPAEELGHS